MKISNSAVSLFIHPLDDGGAFTREFSAQRGEAVLPKPPFGADFTCVAEAPELEANADR
jgi:hypothetical protein